MAWYICSSDDLPYHSSCIFRVCTASSVRQVVHLCPSRRQKLQNFVHLLRPSYGAFSSICRPSNPSAYPGLQDLCQSVLKSQTISLLCKRCTSNQQSFRLANMCSNDSALASPIIMTSIAFIYSVECLHVKDKLTEWSFWY